jgi:hypothetical protein
MAEDSLVGAERLDGGRIQTTHLTTARGPEMTAADRQAPSALSLEGVGGGMAPDPQTTAAGLLLKTEETG